MNPLQKTLLIAFLMLSYQGLLAQDLYIPRDMQETYENGSRSKDGNPGKNYWQNHGRYDIKININPPNRTIYGTETITYFNNSPDTLQNINFKLFLNLHKPESYKMRAVSKDYLTSGIHIDLYKENGKERSFVSNNTINKLQQLAKPLAPNDSITFYFKWHFDLSKQSGREGVIDSTTFFLAYFYPRVAVYDDYVGWDKTAVQGYLEFYNDFNDYTFQVTAPEGYLIWATGTFQNPKEVLQEKYVKRLNKSMKSDSIIHVVTQEDIKARNITQPTSNLWKWEAKNITDIALAISNHYNWDAGSVVVDSTSGRRSSVQAAYDVASKDFKKMVQYGKHALNWFSNNYPGIPYPYPTSTIIRGFADMEYPMMANDNSTGKDYFTRFVVEHEIAHTYFPFYMGINETRFAFMDEGWATALEFFIGVNDLGKERAIEFFKKFRVEKWIQNPSFEGDLPIITPSNLLRRSAYGINAYGKSALGYLALKDLLGDQLFKKSLQGYMKRWAGKHPLPWDFFFSFNDISQRNLNWFWDSWFFSYNYIDYQIESVKKGKKSTSITLKNIGGMPAPFDVIVTTKDNKQKIFHQTPILWKSGNNQTTIELKKVITPRKIEINGNIWMDATPENNIWKP